MRVLLLGGTGAIGKHLASILLEQGNSVSVTSRGVRGRGGAIRYIEGNAREIGFVETVLKEKWDCVVDFMICDTSLFAERIKYFPASCGQYVFLSTGRIFADSQSPITEDSARLLETSPDREYLATDEYALTKARQEDILSNTPGLKWTITRPYITYDRNRLQLGHLEKEHWLYRALHGRSILFSRDMYTKRTTLTYGLDVAAAIASLIGEGQALRSAFNITTRKSIAWSKVLDIYTDTIEKCLGFRPKIMLQDLDESCSWYPAKYQILYDRLYDRVFDPKKISKFIDVNKFSPPSRTLELCLTQFLQNPVFHAIDWKAEVKKDRLTNEVAGLSEFGSIKSLVKYSLSRKRVPLSR